MPASQPAIAPISSHTSRVSALMIWFSGKRRERFRRFLNKRRARAFRFRMVSESRRAQRRCRSSQPRANLLARGARPKTWRPESRRAPRLVLSIGRNFAPPAPASARDNSKANESAGGEAEATRNIHVRGGNARLRLRGARGCDEAGREDQDPPTRRSVAKSAFMRSTPILPKIAVIAAKQRRSERPRLPACPGSI